MTDMNTRLIPWTIEIAGIDTHLRVGIWEHELEPQPIRINLTLRAIAPAHPASIDDCVNYEPVCRWMIDEWPRHPHTQLLETRLRELLTFVFRFDARIEWIDASISKPQAIAGVGGVGLRLAMTRDDFETAFQCAQEVASIGLPYISAKSQVKFK